MIKLARNITLLAMLASISVVAGDDPSEGMYAQNQTMPVLTAGQYGTDEDNENNALTGVADGDMDTYLFNTSSIHPIEFNIEIDKVVGTLGGVLEMNVYDIDLPDEVDEVFINGVKIGTLIGADGKWGINRMTIAPGILKQGNNLVQVFIDKNDEGWATTIDYAIISGVKHTQGGILRCWVSPTNVNAGETVNFFAEMSGKPKKIQLYNGDMRVQIKQLSDPDKDGVYSTYYKIPGYMGNKNKGLKDNFKIRAEGPWGVSWCPGVNVK